jgi:hypothetical protein
MAFSAVTARGSAVDTVNDTSITVNPTANLTVGKLVFVSLATKNISTTDGATNDHSIADTHTHTWTKVEERTETEAGAAGDGSTISLFYAVVTTQIATTDVITGTTSGNTAEKIITVFEATFDNTNKVPAIAQVGLGPNAIAATVSGLVSREYLLVGAAAAEGADTAKTPDGDYTEQFDLRSRNNAAAITIHVQTRIATLTGDTVTSTAWTATQPYTLLAAIYEADPPVSRAPDAGVLTLAGVVPSLAFAFGIAAGALGLTGHAPELNVGPRIEVPAGSLVFKGPQRPAQGNVTAEPAVGALAFTGYAPSLQFGFSPPTGELSLTGQTPAAQSGVTITPDAGALSLEGQFVGVFFKGPDPGELALTGQSPSLDFGVFVPAGVLTFTGQTPALSITIAVTPDAGTLSLTGQAPSLALGFEIPAGSLALTGDEPTLSSGNRIEVDAGALAFTGQAPALTTDGRFDPSAGSLTFTGYAPALTYDTRLDPAAGSLAFTGHAPTLSAGTRIDVDAGSLTLTGYAPSLTYDVRVDPAAGVLSLTGLEPVASVDVRVSPDAGALTFTGHAPSIVGEGAVSPDTAALVLTGRDSGWQPDADGPRAERNGRCPTCAGDGSPRVHRARADPAAHDSGCVRNAFTLGTDPSPERVGIDSSRIRNPDSNRKPARARCGHRNRRRIADLDGLCASPDVRRSA